MARSNSKTIYDALGRSPVHPFPARMAPGIAFDVLSKSSDRLRILDPMMGSGTVLALARAGGHKALGVDIDPLAVLIGRVWTSAVDRVQVRKTAASVLQRALRTSQMPLRDAYPTSADDETRRFIRYWFDGRARRQLTSLARAIGRVRDSHVRDVLWCAFSRLIIAKQAGASLAMDLAHSRPHKAFAKAPIEPFSKFSASVDHVLENCISKHARGRGSAPSIALGDARHLRIPTGSIDLVLTSPPYLNAIDYMRCSKFSLVWMGRTTRELREVRSKSVGTELTTRGEQPEEYVADVIKALRVGARLSRRHIAMLGCFIKDMHSSVSEVARVLVPGGQAIYVVGENTITGTYVRNAYVMKALARRVGLVFGKETRRILPQNRRYLPPPTRRTNARGLDIRIRREVVLSFSKPKQ